MRFVFDANILMAILISGRAFHKVILETFDILTPDFALIEIDKYSEVIVEKSNRNKLEHLQYAYSVFSAITVIPRYLIKTENIRQANLIIGTTDPKDISYLALAIQTDSLLITQDKPIVEAARKQGFRRIMLFDEFIQQYA